MRIVFVIAALALVSAGCEDPPKPKRYHLSLPFTVPDGTDAVVDGKKVGTFDGQHATVRLPDGASLSAAKSLAVRFPTVCGHAERAFTLSGDELRGREDGASDKMIRVAVEMKRSDVPVRSTVWVDPEAKGDVVVGKATLGRGGNRIVTMDCDEAGRTVTVDGQARGALPAYDPKSLDQLFVPATADACFALVSHVYDKSGPVPDRRTSTALPAKPLHVVPLINFFLQEPPAEIEVLEKTETKLELKRVECAAGE